MIFKILIAFYRWLYGLPPYTIEHLDEKSGFVIIVSCLVDIVVFTTLIGISIDAYKSYKRKKKYKDDR